VRNPGHLPVVRWCHFCCLVFSGLVIRYDIINTGYDIYSTIYHFMCENFILTHIKECIQFWPKTGCDKSGIRAVLTEGRKPRVD
jgi:hypothetical protein